MGEWGAAAVSGAIVAILTAVGFLLERYFRSKSRLVETTAAAEERKESVVVKELKELVEMQRADGIEDRKQIHGLRDEMQTLSSELALCQASHARAEERIAALEDALVAAGIPHRKWAESGSSGGSKSHRPLPREEGAADE